MFNIFLRFVICVLIWFRKITRLVHLRLITGFQVRTCSLNRFCPYSNNLNCDRILFCLLHCSPVRFGWGELGKALEFTGFLFTNHTFCRKTTQAWLHSYNFQQAVTFVSSVCIFLEFLPSRLISTGKQQLSYNNTLPCEFLTDIRSLWRI